MDLLPRTHHEFGSKDYWERFFTKRGSKAFEWYGEFGELSGTLLKYIRPTDRILVAGCGNSELSANFYDVGYHNIVNVDISSTVVHQMSAKHADARPDMKFLQMDLLEMSFADDEFSVVLDKGTIDAIFTHDTTEVVSQIDKMLQEIGRVLRVGGRFVCITLAQEHIASHIVHSFADKGWMTRICRVPYSSKDVQGRDFQLPVFVFVFTKFRKMPNAKLILELSYFEDKPDRFDSVDELLQSVKELQHYAILRQQLNSGAHLEDQISLDLYSSSDSRSPRYTIHVVDGPRVMPPAKKFAIFIVPQGREMEWMFLTSEGRIQLHQSAGYERLLVVTLHREHIYDSLESVKSELSGKVLELAPPNVAKQSPFLSLGDEINIRTERYRGTSSLSGEFVVEDVDVSGDLYRRLIFLSNKNLVQSEARLVQEGGSGKRKGGKNASKNKSGPVSVDHNYLASNYYGTIVAGLSLIRDLPQALEAGLHIVLIGLGGGGLPMFLRNNIPKVEIDVVEIDEAVVSVATDWFNFTTDDRLRISVADGLEYIQQLDRTGCQQDVVILDVDSKNVSLGMSCPPAAFVEAQFLKSVDQILKPSGILMLNLVCRSSEKRQSVMSTLKSVFRQVCSVKLKEDVNETVYCFPSTSTQPCDSSAVDILPLPAVEHLQNVLRTSQQQQHKRSSANDMLDLAAKLENLKWQ